MATRSLLPAVFFIGLCTAWVDERPVLETRDGNLVIASAKDRNITLRTFGKSSINVNDINLVDVSIRAKEAARIVEKWENGYLRSLTGDLNRLMGVIEGPNGLQRRLSALEFGGDASSNSTTRPDASRIATNDAITRAALRQVNGRIRTVERNVRIIRVKLRTNECSNSPCKNGGTCIWMYDGYQCICPDNWMGPTCDEDVNECLNFAGTALGCQNGASCTNLPGSYRCNCAPNWHGIHCTTKSSACDAQDSRELCGHGTCLAKTGSILGYTCICEQGWESEGSDPACSKDIDECAGKHPACSINPPVPCVNVPGSYHCGTCPRGFTGNGHYCTDIDECATDNGGCSITPRVQCINTVGSSTCGTCPAGYQGDGTYCSYVGVCRINNGGCHPLATCVQVTTYASVLPQCNCPAGYHGHGVGPMGCLPGVDTIDPCANNLCVHGTCHPNGPLYTCHCNPGFTGTHCDTAIDPCKPNPCLHEGICRSTDSRTITCECTSKFMGSRCETERQSCGGLFRNPSGVLEYPMNGGTYAHDLNCAFVILTNVSRVLNITFTRFDFEKSHTCRFDFLQIHDGANAGAHQMGRFCGTDLPLNGNFVTTHNAVYLWLRSDSSSAHQGFALHWNTVEPTCGKTLTAYHGTISSPGSPGKYPNNRDCFWEVIVRPGKRIQFHFFTVMMEEHPTCDYDYLEINETDGNREILLGLYCNHTHPAPLTTSGSYAKLHFHSDERGSDMGFQISYSTVEGVPGCGGVFTADHGVVTSPNYPDTYPPRMVCDWKIQLPKGERIRLTWMAFSLESNRACRFDSVSIFAGPTPESPIVGKYCGTDLPAAMTIDSNEAVIVFRSDWSIERTGFQLKYETLCGGQFYESSGQISSPYYPLNYPASRTCTYEIIQPPGKGIVLTIVDMQIEKAFDATCSFDNLQIYDGDNDNSTVLGTLCGNSGNIPNEPYYSTHNYMFVKFVTDASIHNRGFFANYTTIDRRCGGLLKAPTGIIQSHTDSETYSRNQDCTWTLKAPIGHVVQLTFTTFGLEGGASCGSDYVLVYDGASDSGQEMGRYCGSTKPEPLITQTESMTIRFHTDDSINDDGFIAHYVFIDGSKVCGGHYYTPTGVITSPNYPDVYPPNKECVWIITVANKRLINLDVETFNVERVADCSFDYLQIRNGGTASSPLIGNFCGTKIPNNFLSLTNSLYLKFVTDSSRQKGGFRLNWDSSTYGCGGTLTGSKGEIISPNYPRPYNRLANCQWKIAVASGSKVQFVTVDFDLEDNARCRYDYLEISTGTGEHHTNGQRYCGSNLPAYIDVDSNLVFLRFRSDYTNAGNGFHLRYQTKCENTLRGFSGTIESLNFPNEYPPGLNCTWIIVAPTGNKINVTFSHFELEGRSSSNDCTFDYLTIGEGEGEVADTEIGKYCGSDKLPDRVSSTQSKVFVHFVTDRYFNYGGFRLEWTIVGCGGLLTRPQGEFTSPNYPNAYPENIECEWLIELDHGHSVEISFPDVQTENVAGCTYDKVQLYAGKDTNAPKISEFCHAQKTLKFTSPTNKLFIKFSSDFSFAGRGFKATYRSVEILCGGEFFGYQSLIHSMNYPMNYLNSQNCEWLLQVDKNHVINLKFEDFDIEDTTNCTDDYVKVFDGKTRDDPVLGTFCKNVLPPPIISTSNSMLVVMRSDSFVSAKGFQATFSKACGARIITDGSGTLQTEPLVHMAEDTLNCTWIIEAQDPADHVTLTFVHVDVGTSWDSECEQHYIRVYEGDSIDGSPLGTWCGSKAPPPLTSAGNALTVHLYTQYGVSDARFGATYTVLNSACGGEYLSASGTLVSPSYPNSYPMSAECIWLLKTSPGNRIGITFSVFELETSPNCDRDYLEIREDSGVGKLVGVYCAEPPTEIISSKKLWIKFRSDDTGTAKGFVAEYNFLHGNVLTGISGDISSPLYPLPYRLDNTVTWQITVNFGMAIRIEFNDTHFENFGDYCSSGLSIYDGFNEEAPELASICGISPPHEATTSSSNVLCLTFRSDYFREGNWFYLHWYQVPRVPSTANTVEKISDCVVEYDLTSMVNRSVVFHSPGWPENYADRLDCMWIFTSPPGYHLIADFDTVDLEESMRCTNDYVAIYNGNGLTTSLDQLQLLEKVCHSNDTNREIVGKSVITVRFYSDYYINKRGFQASVWKKCGGELFGPNGVIDFNETRSMYDRHWWNFRCEYNITVKAGRTIEVSFTNFHARAGEDGTCKENYILLKDGAGPESPLLGLGKYCGNLNLSATYKTTGNKLYAKAVGMGSNLNFKLSYREVSMACGGSYRLGDGNGPQTKFNSPNYPNIPPPFSECFWTFMAPAGEKLSLHFIERFDLASSINCTREYVEVRDGGTEYSTLLGRFCRDVAPSSITATGNMLYVHFYTDVPDPKNGFRAAVTSGDICGGILRDETGVIRSSNYPNTYPNNQVCGWWIIGPPDRTLKIEFRDIHLPSLRRCENADYVTIGEKLPMNESINAFGTYCGSRKPDVLETSSNEAIVSFHSDNRTSGNYRGFVLNYTSSRDSCGGPISGMSGEFKSAGYPNPGLRSRHCDWLITVPEGSQVVVEILDVDVGETNGGNPNGMYLAFYNEKRWRTVITTIRGPPYPREIRSTSNFMLVVSWFASGHRGFKARYTAAAPAPCGGSPPGDGISGSLSLPPPPYNATAFFCPWKLRVPESMIDSQNRTGATLTITISGSIGDYGSSSRDCSYRGKYISINDGKHDVGMVCGNITNGNYVVRSPALINRIDIMNGTSGGRINYDLRYEWKACGGILAGPSHTISAPKNIFYPKSCAWHAKFEDPGSVITLTFERMNLGSCDKGFIIVRNGGPLSPEVGKFCGNIIPYNITSSSNQLWIEYWASQDPGDFVLHLNLLSGSCGGSIRGSNKEIMSPGFPNQYPNNAECTWEITANPGHTVGLYFVDRFSLETSDNCAADFIQLFDWRYDDKGNGGWRDGPKFCGRNTPVPYNATSNRLKVLFRTSEAIQGDGFRAMWEENCGGIFEATSHVQYIESPRYPDIYLPNLFCQYKIIGPKNAEVRVEFLDFDLEGRNSNCKYDNVTISTNHYYRKSSIYCGDKLPPPVHSEKELSIVFRSDVVIQKRGFRFKYFLNECGGEITEPTQINPPSKNDGQYFGRLNCTWVIRAPEGKSVVLRFEKFHLEMSHGCIFDYVLVVEGDNLVRGKNLARLCGNVTDLFPVKSVGNMMTVVFRSDGSHEFGGMSASIVFTTSEASGCGGKINLTSSTSFRTQRANTYESLEDCHWSVVSPIGENVKFTINRMDLKNSTNNTLLDGKCSGDYIEVRDGRGPFSQLIGQYCGNVPPQPITSTLNALWIRFFTDGTVEGEGVVGTLEPTASLCGKHFYDINNTAVHIESRNYPADFPVGMQCRWIFKSQIAYSQLLLHFDELDLEDDQNCEGDHLEINDQDVQYITKDFGEDFVYNGRQSRRTHYGVGRYSPDATYRYCGQSKALSYYSNNNEIRVTLKTTTLHLPKPRKFKFEVSTMSCSRNYTSEQGRILHRSFSDCWTTITTAPNRTISMYFNLFRVYDSANCAQNYIEVHDGDFRSPVVQKLCGLSSPNPIFSTGNQISIRTKSARLDNYGYDIYDIIYTTTDNGRGCGGQIFNYIGVFTSPMYPGNYRNDSLCTWEISVPRGYQVALNFAFFDLGTSDICETDYLQVLDEASDYSRRETYCPGNIPATFRATSNVVKVIYASSVNNGGTGWEIRFAAVHSSDSIEGPLSLRPRY